MQKIKVAVDLWNGYLKGTVFWFEDNKTVVLAKDLQKTRWIKKWKIVDQSELSDSFGQMIKNFNNKLGGDYVDDIVLGISHPEMIISRYTENKRVMSERVWQEDVWHLMKVISDLADKNNYEILKINPVYRLIDDEFKTNEPIGMQGRKLELVVDVFYIPRSFYQGIVDLANQLQLNILDIVPNILWASELVLDYDLRDLGTLLVDIWNNQTSYVVYEDGYPKYYGIIPIGWENVTKDISIGMQLDIKSAENLKIDYATITAQEATGDDSLDIKFLEEIITARYMEIFERINQTLERLWKDGRLPWGVILVWGGAKMRGVDLLAKEVFKLSTTFGKNKVLPLWDFGSNLQFINNIGVYYFQEKFGENNRWLKLNISFGRMSKVWQFLKEAF